MSDMSTEGLAVVVVLALAVFGILGVIWLLILGFATLIHIIFFVMVGAVLFSIILGILVLFSAIPFYFIKGSKAEPGDYRIEDIRDGENERKGDSG